MRLLFKFAAATGLAIAAPLAAHTEGHVASTTMSAANQQAMQAALADARRADDRARDPFRNPAETLAFFGVEPGMTVVDYMPAGGWYTRVLVPYLGTNGRYIGLTPDPAAADNERFATYFAGLPKDYSDNVGKWNLAGAPSLVAATGAATLEPYQGEVDRVLIFREMHNLYRSGVLHSELTRIRNLLADDGMLGIVQHRAKPWASGDYTSGNNGYLRQQDVIGLVEAHGFELVGTSEVNANPRDTADYEGGVWELPPGMRGNIEARRAIGESDRMTLLFRKR